MVTRATGLAAGKNYSQKSKKIQKKEIIVEIISALMVTMLFHKSFVENTR